MPIVGITEFKDHHLLCKVACGNKVVTKVLHAVTKVLHLLHTALLHSGWWSQCQHALS